MGRAPFVPASCSSSGVLCHGLQLGSLLLSFRNSLRGEFASLDPLWLIFLPKEAQLSASVVILKSKQRLDCKELPPGSGRAFLFSWDWCTRKGLVTGC